MRVAFITPYLPWPADTGGKLRSYYLIKGLAQHAEVDLYTFRHMAVGDAGPLTQLCRNIHITPIELKPGAMGALQSLINPLPRSVRWFQSPSSLQQVRALLAAPEGASGAPTRYDLIVCDEIVVTPYVWQIEGSAEVPRLINRQKIDHLHYAETARSRPPGMLKVLDWIEGQRLRRFEYQEMAKFQAAVVCSPEDKREAQREVLGPDAASAQGQHLALYEASAVPIEIIVNGADTTYFRPQRQPDQLPTVLLLGTMHYYPNIDAVQHYFQTMHDALRSAVPNLRVLIVGHNPPPEIMALGDLPGVTVTGSVPDIRPWMARAWLQMVPLRLGGGTRLKIVESMAAGLPVVSTTVGAQGLAVQDGDEMLLADEPAEFVAKVASLLNSPEESARIALAARAFVEANYSWQSLGERFATFCSDTVETHNAQLAARAVSHLPMSSAQRVGA